MQKLKHHYLNIKYFYALYRGCNTNLKVATNSIECLYSTRSHRIRRELSFSCYLGLQRNEHAFKHEILRCPYTSNPFAEKARLLEFKPWMNERMPLQIRVKSLMECPELRPDDFSRCSVVYDIIKRCCELRTMHGVQLAQDVLDCLLYHRKVLKSKNRIVCLDTDIIQMVLYAWALLADKHSISQNRMKELIMFAVNSALFPDGKDIDVSFAINVKLRSKFDSSSKAQSQTNLARTTNPTRSLFNTYLLGLANAAKLTPQAAVRAESILSDMTYYHDTYRWCTDPNTRSFSYVIQAYANTKGQPEFAQKAYSVLCKMWKVHEIESRQYFYDYGIQYNAAEPLTNKRRVVTPDAVVYTLMMKALVACADSETLRQVSNLWNEAMIKDNEGRGVIVDEKLCITTIKAIGICIEKVEDPNVRLRSAWEAQQIFEYIVRTYPTRGNSGKSLERRQLYSSQYDNKLVINGIESFNSSKNDHGRAAESRISATGRSELLSCFNACLDVWSRAYCHGSARQCESLLLRCLNSVIYDDQNLSKTTGGRYGFKPDVISFNSVLYGEYFE